MISDRPEGSLDALRGRLDRVRVGDVGGSTSARPPSSSTSRAVVSSRSTPRATRPSHAPSAAKARAVPADAPVITTTLQARLSRLEPSRVSSLVGPLGGATAVAPTLRVPSRRCLPDPIGRPEHKGDPPRAAKSAPTLAQWHHWLGASPARVLTVTTE